MNVRPLFFIICLTGSCVYAMEDIKKQVVSSLIINGTIETGRFLYKKLWRTKEGAVEVKGLVELQNELSEYREKTETRFTIFELPLRTNDQKVGVLITKVSKLIQAVQDHENRIGALEKKIEKQLQKKHRKKASHKKEESIGTKLLAQIQEIVKREEENTLEQTKS